MQAARTPEKKLEINARARELHALNPSANNDKSRAWRERNPEQLAEIKRNWRLSNPEKVKEQRERWKRHNAALVSAYVRGRTTTIKEATPPWADLDAMTGVYDLARALTAATGEQHQVDHIVPLTHPLVCGLHCEANLQVLTKAANLSKANKFEPG